MPISKDLSVSPYFDDFKESLDYYKILMKPGVAVQTRELNQLQTILQNQVEKFGDNIYKSGTIIDGCNITTHDKLPYVKIRDFQDNGLSVDAESFKGLYVRNSANLSAYIVEAVNGFEAATPNLNTIYLKYINSGNTQNSVSFSANEQLTIYDPDSPIFSVYVSNGSAGFSNSDSIIVTPSITVSNSIGGTDFANDFFVGDIITNGLGANVEITSVDIIDGNKVLTYKPLVDNLVSGNAATWRIDANNAITDSNTAEHAIVTSLVGSGLQLSLITDTVGKIKLVNIENNGTGYYSPPFVSVYSTSANSSQLASANLVPYNYKSIVTVANNNFSPAGYGYGVTIGDGIVYQKGFFLRVSNQLAIVSKYNQPNDLVLGFNTTEEIIDSNDDQSLLDNSTGTNQGAPGADRLKLTPYLSILSTAEASANSDFLVLMEFKNGIPYKQVTQTQYDIIEDNIAKRTMDTSGDFTINKFLSTTTSPTDFALEANTFEATVDTGIAYINGHRVETKNKFVGDVSKGLVERTSTGGTSTNYGSYVLANNLAGDVPFSTNEVYEIRDTASTFSAGVVSLPGTVIGYCRVRSILAQNDFDGSYAVYLYDIQMNSGYSFTSARSICYNGTNKGSVNIILENSKAVIKDANYNGIIFNTGLDAVKSISNVSYTYRTVFNDLVSNTSGYVSKTLSSGESFPEIGQLSTADELGVIVIPNDTLISTANLSGNVSTSNTSNIVNGSNTNFLDLNAGDWLYIANNTANTFSKISSIANNTQLTLTSNCATSFSTANVASYFPKNVPINLQVDSRTANVSANGSTMTIYLGGNYNTANLDIITDVLVNNATPATRTVKRNVFVRIDTSNNVSNTAGPFCLGITDIIRLNKVYKGSNNTFTVNDGLDVTKYFYCDNNQNVDYLNSGYLMINPTSGYHLDSGDTLLVEVDCLTGVDGPVWIDSYPIDDSKTLANSSATMNTMELAELYGVKDEYYDVRDCIDFRPRSVNTANVATTDSSATINPEEPTMANRFDTSPKKYPSPNKTVSLTATYYNGRKDTIVIDELGTISVLEGGDIGAQPKKPDNSILIDKLTIPPYPSIPMQLSPEYATIIDTKMASEKYSDARYNKYKITSTLTSSDVLSEQPRGYTMSDIGSLDRRIGDLEYYVSFTLQEAYAQDKSIPSAANDAIDRFKFGYFVDPFDNDTYADKGNPAFLSEFVNSRLVPPHDRVNIKIDALDKSIKADQRIYSPYEEFTIVDQPYATTEASGYTQTVATQKITNQLVTNQNNLLNAQGLYSEVSEFYMSSTSGPVELYYNFRNNRASIEIYQGDSSGFSLAGKTPIYSSASAVAMNNSDTYLRAYELGYLEGYLGPIYTGSPSKPAVANSGKMLFTHNPANGRYYKIVVTKFYYFYYLGWYGQFAYRLFYPTDTVEVTSVPGTVTVINTDTGTTTTRNVIQTSDGTSTVASGVNSFKYNGILSTNKQWFTYSNLYQAYLGQYFYPVNLGDSFVVTISGMKPNTSHSFYVNGKDLTSNCKQLGKGYAEGIFTDANGFSQFQYYYDPYSGVAPTQFVYYQVLNSVIYTQSLAFKVSNSDESSLAQGTVGSGIPYGYRYYYYMYYPYNYYYRYWWY